MKRKQNRLIKNTVPRIIVLLVWAAVLTGAPRIVTGNSGDTDVIIAAMKDEMARSMTSLKIESMEKPYYMEYSLVDHWQLEIEGSFGSLTTSAETRQRMLKVGIRVGSHQLDNTGFVDRSGMFRSMMGGSGSTVIDDDYNALRRDLWLTTDSTYKQALEQLAGKNAYLKNQAQTEEIPDFSKEKSVQKLLPRKTLKIDREKWEKTVKKLSSVFRDFPALHESHVEMRVILNHRYFVNSEGTVVRRPETLVSLAAHAATQAPDGMKLKHYVPFYALTVEELPGEKQLTAGIKKMAEELTALASAPVLENYIGPVLQASGELFAQVLVPHLSGQRPPLSDMPGQTGNSSKLANRLNRKVLPRELSIIDDPTRNAFEKQPLIGSYAVDDEGVAARPVTLVEKGVLKTLLMSRRPRKEISHSNGHARAGLRGNAGVQIGNLVITANEGKTYRELKEELLQLCRDQQMPCGLMVKTFDNPGITGMERSAFSIFLRSSRSGTPITSPVIMVRVYVEDGREELVRGISLSGLEVDDLKDIAAVGKDSCVLHRMLSAGGGMMSSVFMLLSGRGGGGMGVPASIVAPSVLFEEIELKKKEEKSKKPPLLIHPFFAK
jgi:predicted Zn-dependent protease